MKKHVSFGTTSVRTINKVGQSRNFPVIKKPNRNNFPPGREGNSRYLNAHIRWMQRSKNKRSVTPVQANPVALLQAIAQAEQLASLVRIVNNNLTSFLKSRQCCYQYPKRPPNHRQNNNNNLYS